MRFAWVLLACLSAMAAEAPRGKTYLLAVGISKYEKLPRDLWLQYADADAKAFAAFLATPPGGSVPAAQMLVLANEQATAAALRNAFRTFLKNGPGRDDTVYILIAGHGTVDAGGAYILTYDSDAEKLSTSALPMAELHTVVEEELTRAGRVVFLADVCRAGAIAGQKTSALGATVEKMGDGAGEMLGLMAARPKELSLEAADYGGGHGAFTWSVLKGLSGAADRDHDGFVTAGELIDYVSADVASATANKQHPRDFGNMDNGTKLSAVAH